jgi:hypothetical protein
MRSMGKGGREDARTAFAAEQLCADVLILFLQSGSMSGTRRTIRIDGNGVAPGGDPGGGEVRPGQ